MSDGRILFGLQNDREWWTFATHVLERPDLASDPRLSGNQGRAAHRAELEPVIAGTLRGRTTSEAMARLERAGIGTARINEMDEVWAHPQLQARGRYATVSTPAGPIPALRPVTGQGWTARMDPVPALGEHTDAVLRKLGLDRA